MNRNRRSIVMILIFLPAIIFFLYVLYKNLGPYLKIFHKPRLMREWILSFGKWGFMAFIILQVAQVVLMFVPGEVIQAAGGYMFGTFWGMVLALLGILVGSVITFIIGRVFGERLLRRIISGKKLLKIKTLVNKPENKIVLIILYLIPGIPKDILGYISGITPIRLKEFAVISTATRIPGVLASTYLGSNLYQENYLLLSISVVVILLLICLLAWKKEKILSYIK